MREENAGQGFHLIKMSAFWRQRVLRILNTLSGFFEKNIKTLPSAAFITTCVTVYHYTLWSCKCVLACSIMPMLALSHPCMLRFCFVFFFERIQVNLLNMHQRINTCTHCCSEWRQQASPSLMHSALPPPVGISRRDGAAEEEGHKYERTQSDVGKRKKRVTAESKGNNEFAGIIK